MSTLEDEFHAAMIGIYDQAARECGYYATRYLQMVTNRGGLAAAQRLLASGEIPDGFVTLWKLGRLDLTVEALVLQPKYAPLFTEEEKNIARTRLEDCGYRPD